MELKSRSDYQKRFCVEAKWIIITTQLRPYKFPNTSGNLDSNDVSSSMCRERMEPKSLDSIWENEEKRLKKS